MSPVRQWPDAGWKLKLDSNGCISWEQVGIAVLMDIRHELQELNRLLGCRNFMEIPASLKAIKQNTSKPKRKPK